MTDVHAHRVDMVKKPLVSTDRGTMRSEHTHRYARDTISLHHIDLMARDIDLESAFTKGDTACNRVIACCHTYMYMYIIA